MNTSVDGLQAMELWLNALDPSLNYTLKEELSNGDIATHWKTADTDVFTHDELDAYVHNIWLPSHPAELIICPCGR